MSLDDVVSLTISTETQTLSQRGFGLGMILGYNDVFDPGELYRKYDNPSDMITDGFSADHPQYLAAQKYFSQSPRPESVIVGLHPAPNSKIVLRVVGAVAEDDVFTVKFKVHPDPGTVGTEYTASVTADADDVAADIVGKLETVLTAIANVAATSDANTCTFDADAADVMIEVTSATSNLDVRDETADPGVATAIANIDAQLPEEDLWYAVATQYNSEPIVDAMAAAIEAISPRRVYFTDTRDTDVDSVASTDVASELHANAYARTSMVYKTDTNASWAGTALMGKLLPKIPGSYTAMFKTLAGVSVDKLTSTTRTRVKDKGCNIYTRVGGKNILEEGLSFADEYIDTVIFVDWLHARIQENVFAALANADKIPFTDSGIGVVTAAIEQILQIGIQNGGLSNDPAPFVTAPLASAVPSNDKANRHLPDVEFEGVLAGAIHSLTIRGRVTV